MALLFMHKKESPVLPDRTTNSASIAVIAPFRIFCKRLPGNAVGTTGAEPVVRVQLVVLVIPVTGTVPSVDAPPRDHLNLGTQRTGEVHSCVVRLHPKLFQA